MALSPSVPNRVVKVTLSEEVFQGLRLLAFARESTPAGLLREAAVSIVESERRESLEDVVGQPPVVGELARAVERDNAAKAKRRAAVAGEGGAGAAREAVVPVASSRPEPPADAPAAPPQCRGKSWEATPAGAVCTVCRVLKRDHG